MPGGWSVMRPILLAILLGGVSAAAFAHHKKKEDRDAMSLNTHARLRRSGTLSTEGQVPPNS